MGDLKCVRALNTLYMRMRKMMTKKKKEKIKEVKSDFERRGRRNSDGERDSRRDERKDSRSEVKSRHRYVDYDNLKPEDNIVRYKRSPSPKRASRR